MFREILEAREGMIKANWNEIQALEGTQFCNFLRQAGRGDEFCEEAYDGLLKLGTQQAVAFLFTSISQ